MALESKGFNPTGRRSSLVELEMRSVDWWSVAGIAAVVIGMVWLRTQGYGVVLGGRL